MQELRKHALHGNGQKDEVLNVMMHADECWAATLVPTCGYVVVVVSFEGFCRHEEIQGNCADGVR